MSHKHCIFCGEEVPCPRPTNWSLVCIAPNNTTAPDTTGNRYHAVPVIAAEDDDVCELCGKVAECRPYGPNGERICFNCGMKDKATTERMMGKVLFGEGKPQ